MSHADLENLPARLRNRPDVRAYELKVYRVSERHFQVPGRSRIYDLFLVDGTIHCTCRAADYGAECSHKIAVDRYLKERKP